MARPCKICELDEELRDLIEDDMRLHVKPSVIISKYPQAGLNYSNIRTHRMHFKKRDAIDKYESNLHQRAKSTTSDCGFSTPSSTPKVTQGEKDKPKNELNTVPETNIIPKKLSPLPESPNNHIVPTGDPIIDDLNALDLIIGQAQNILDKVKPQDVIKAIETKQKLLGNMEENEDVAESEKVNISLILQAIAENED